MWPFTKSIEKIAKKADDEALFRAVRNRIPKNRETWTEIQKGVNAVWALRAETWNGTIEQYFANSAGDEYPLVCDFLRLIGADSTLAALVSFGSRFGESDEFPSRSTRIDFITRQEERDEQRWEALVRKSSDEISDTFDRMMAHVADFLRSNLGTIEPNKTRHSSPDRVESK